jgi:hypothetical protein
MNEEFEQFQQAVDGMSMLALNASLFYKGLRKEGIGEEVAGYITGIFVAHCMKFLFDRNDASDD